MHVRGGLGRSKMLWLFPTVVSNGNLCPFPTVLIYCGESLACGLPKCNLKATRVAWRTEITSRRKRQYIPNERCASVASVQVSLACALHTSYKDLSPISPSPSTRKTPKCPGHGSRTPIRDVDVTSPA